MKAEQEIWVSNSQVRALAGSPRLTSGAFSNERSLECYRGKDMNSSALRERPGHRGSQRPTADPPRLPLHCLGSFPPLW